MQHRTAERFRELARAQLPRLYSLARRLVGDDAEDAVQDCLLKGFQRFHQLDDEAAGPAGLAAIEAPDRPLRQRLLRTPGPAAFDDAYHEGERLPPTQAVSLALTA